jgi:outer membrane protein assembly factor BamB
LKDTVMKSAIGRVGVVIGCLVLLGEGGGGLFAQDWPQWRGPHRDAIATGFKAPKAWPKTLTKKWKVDVGDGVATPALVGDKLYVFARRGDDEVTACLDATTGKEIWAEKFAAKPASGAASQFPGPRSSPTVADGKVVTLGVQGTLSCLDATSGKVLWRKVDVAEHPRFFTSCSPIVVDELCIVQVGGEEKGGIAAYEMANGNQKWEWTGDGTAYASPDLLTVDGVKMVVALTAGRVVGIGIADGKLLWETPFANSGMGAYNAESPIVGGQTMYISGSFRGTQAIKIEKEGDRYTTKQLWKNAGLSVQFNTPVLKNGQLYGISSKNFLFCLNADSGKQAWTERVRGDRGYGSVVDVGPVLLALTTNGQLVVFEPNDKKFSQLARYKVADEGTYAYPVAAGNRIYVKDFDALTLWTVE